MSTEVLALLIEDNDQDADLVFRALDGFANERDRELTFLVCRASTLAEAATHFGESTFDLVVLDLDLPDSAGLDTFLRIEEMHPDAAIVILTKNEDPDVAVRAVQLGAQDFLTKSDLTPNELHRDLRYAYERGRLQRVERALQQNFTEMEAARAIQKQLFPKTAPDLEGFDLAGGCAPAAATGGDYFDYFWLSDGTLGIVIADVSSHGFAPALIMSSTRRTLRTLALDRTDVGAILTLANRAVEEDTQDHHFVTLFFTRLNPETRVLDYAGAGHCAWVLSRAGNVEVLDSTSLPLGMMSDTIVPNGPSRKLQSGELLVLLTDGFSEAESATGEAYSIQKVLDLVQRHRHELAETIVQRLFCALEDHCHPQPHADDMTVVILKAL